MDSNLTLPLMFTGAALMAALVYGLEGDYTATYLASAASYWAFATARARSKK